jgi:hypothetical protein
MSDIAFQSILVDTSSDDEEGRMIMLGGRLVGVLVRLDGIEHAPLQGSWSLEAGFGPMDSLRPEPFKTLNEARAWAERVLGLVVRPSGMKSNPGDKRT